MHFVDFCISIFTGYGQLQMVENFEVKKAQ